jgi:hypothetical protein
MIDTDRRFQGSSLAKDPRMPTYIRPSPPAIALVLVSVLAACGGGGAKPAGGGSDHHVTPGADVAVTLPADRQAEADRLQAALTATAGLDAAGFTAQTALPFSAALGYDPATALNLPLLQASALKLDGDELAALTARGFMISERKRYPSFTYGYESIYAQDLPLFVSADSILQAVHKSYDEILKAIERASLVGEVGAMLDTMRARLAATTPDAMGASARKDADLYLAVATSLLGETAQAPVAGAPATLAAQLVAKAVAASGTQELTLFGLDRIIDFSQFTPRGHYKGDPVLERYFRAMMWLGRIDFPMLESNIGTDGKVTQVFHRDVFAAAAALASLMDEPTQARWGRIDAVLQAFVGEIDSMTPPQFPRLMADLGAADLGALAAIPDQQVAQAIVSGGYGQQRIASQVILAPPHSGTLPLAATFLLMGQRYVVDSHVFSNLVYDRVNKPPAVSKRMMPNPLDVAYAALRNDQAGALLGAQVTRYQYAPELAGMRLLVDQHGDDYWGGNLYNTWLSALRALSPLATELAGATPSGLPAVATTEAWGRRVLGAQLASWAELRHDTILYVKQSYSGGITCEYPDAYVEPVPAFFARLGALAAQGTALVKLLDVSADPQLGADLTAYFAHLGDVMAILQRMAEHQRTGAPHDAADLTFINRAVRFQPGCGAPSGATGWYPELFFRGGDLTFDPTIADVHTQPTDENGAEVGHVLHVATGHPRLMVVTVDTCAGARAYAGVVSAYHEVITDNYDRLDDQRWSAMLNQATPPDVAWLSDLIVR